MLPSVLRPVVPNRSDLLQSGAVIGFVIFDSPSTCMALHHLSCYSFGKYHAYMRPLPLVGPHIGHVTCHSWYPKEWMKGVMATTRSGYCPFHLFRFPLFYNSLSQLVYCPCHFVLPLCNEYAFLLLMAAILYGSCIIIPCIWYSEALWASVGGL